LPDAANDLKTGRLEMRGRRLYMGQTRTETNLKVTSFTVGFTGRSGESGTGNLKHAPQQKTHCLDGNIAAPQLYVK
jgi:hypothetical protein